MAALKWVGFACIAIGIADIVLSYTWKDITGVSWSPIVAFVVGGVLIKLGGDEEE